jgi:aspartate/methionine/tyrosine aminotransferase
VRFPRLTGGSVDDLAAFLHERYETSIVPGRFFGAPDSFRLGLGLEPGVFREGLRRLGLALDEFGR